jgi:hypothetical protein
MTFTKCKLLPSRPSYRSSPVYRYARNFGWGKNHLTPGNHFYVVDKKQIESPKRLPAVVG